MTDQLLHRAISALAIIGSTEEGAAEEMMQSGVSAELTYLAIKAASHYYTNMSPEVVEYKKRNR